MPWRHRSESDRAGAIEFAQTARKLQQERLDAEEPVSVIRAAAESQSFIRIEPEWITVGVAEKLSHAIAEVIDRSAVQARVLADVALAITTSLGGDYNPITTASAVAHAWKDVALTRWREDDVEAALAAFGRADEVLRPYVALAHDRAMVDAARAGVFHCLGRDEEARELLAAARRTFLDHGDERRAAAAARQLLQVDSAKPS